MNDFDEEDSDAIINLAKRGIQSEDGSNNVKRDGTMV